jgi:hypothetical protein
VQCGNRPEIAPASPSESTAVEQLHIGGANFNESITLKKQQNTKPKHKTPSKSECTSPIATSIHPSMRRVRRMDASL